MDNYPAINRVLTYLKLFPDIPFKHRENTLLIEPKSKDGFQVILEDYSTQFTIFFDLWSYDQIFNDEDAARMFLLGLTATTRLLVKEKNQKRYWWLLETCIDGVWGGVEVTFRPKLYTFWKKKQTYYLQNDRIDIVKHKVSFGANYTLSRQGINYCGICGANLKPDNPFCVSCGK
jgi:hypothetical protein